jgi:membrane protease YdiL (CAAX protease family)
MRELWLRHGQPLLFDRWTAAGLLLFLIGPIQAILSGVGTGNWPVGIYGSAAILGAGGAALAFRVLEASHLRQLGLLLLLAIPIGLVRLLLQLSNAHAGIGGLALGERLGTGIESLLFYVPAVFVAEEVFFRGALDSYLHRDESGAGWFSAAFVSVLWGLWHMPIVGPLSIPVVLFLVSTQLVMGLILSWLWRQAGNLAMPGTMHAIIDAVRNALLF